MLQRVRNWIAHKVVAKICTEFLHRLGAPIIGVLGDIGSEVWVEGFDVKKRRAHIISDQKIVEKLMFDAGHQRVARAFEANPDVPFGAIEIDCNARPSCRNLNEPKILAQCLTGKEIPPYPAFVLCSQWI